MEEKVSPWSANFTSGLILGLVGVVYSLIIWFLDLSFNKIQPFVIIVVQIFLLFYLLKSYRDNFLHGQITYGQSLGAGTIIFVYYAIIMAIYTYILNKFIDTGLIAKQIAFMEEQYIARGMPQVAIDSAIALQKKILKPEIMAPLSIFGSIIGGFIYSLIISIFVRKEGNPLIDSTDN